MSEIEYNFKRVNLGHFLSMAVTIVSMLAGFFVFSLNMGEKMAAFSNMIEHRLTKMENDISWLKSSKSNNQPER